jgi:hypothetical protein
VKQERRPEFENGARLLKGKRIFADKSVRKDNNRAQIYSTDTFYAAWLSVS